MPKPNESWQVLPHGPLTRLAENLYTVTGQLRMPLGETTRHMSVIKLAGDRLAIYSAIALNEPEMQKLEALGTPSYLIVPSAIHRLDVKPWCDRYPELVVLAPRASRKKVGEVVQVDASFADLDDPRARLLTVSGTDDAEFAVIVESDDGKTLIVNDIIFNLPAYLGVLGLGLRLLGFSLGGPSIPKLVKKKLVRDEAALRAQLEAWANLSGLKRLIVSHGEPIEQPRSVLLSLARDLSRHSSEKRSLSAAR